MTSSSIAAYYDLKSDNYFASARSDIVDLLETDEFSSILEIGCGTGVTGELAKLNKKCGIYVGVELNEKSAAKAKECLDQVYVGNAETIGNFGTNYDAVILSEVLEHLIDPWELVKRIHASMKSGGMLFASSPNVANWHLIFDLLKGNFNYTESGVMDISHMRWFTPKTFEKMFVECGFNVVSISGVSRLRWKSTVINILTGGRLRHLFSTQIMIICKK